MNHDISIEYVNEVREFTYTSKVIYCAIITHHGLIKSTKVEADSITILNMIVELTIKKLKFEWERNNFALLDSILHDGLKKNNLFEWKKLLRTHSFNLKDPSEEYDELIASVVKPTLYEYDELPLKPHTNVLSKPVYAEFEPKLSLIDTIFGSAKKISISNKKYDDALAIYQNEQNAIIEWEKECVNVVEQNSNKKVLNEEFINSYNERLEELKGQKLNAISEWEELRDRFIEDQDAYNLVIHQNEKQYKEGEYNAIIYFINQVLRLSNYPNFIEKEYRFEYNKITKILILDYSLPPIDKIPTLKEFKYVNDELRGYYITDNQLNNVFELTSYRIALRIIYELFNADTAKMITAICFNGWVNSMNKATGKRDNKCILSVQTNRDEFIQLDLEHVDPKICFKSLKGISGNKLFNLTSIQPIINLNTNDSRFVDHHSVIENIDDSTNLALIDWEEFEHLIREIFEKEFRVNGGEVKVTQASRDGGVDAIAFDPDPIRGGKIVIQAKRYSNTVGVSAVRDLYGTIMNEGATKGILVTTSDFGSDSYDFAKGKPITLLNGSNLLYLLEKHGQHARIDIQEAKEKLNIKYENS